MACSKDLDKIHTIASSADRDLFDWDDNHAEIIQDSSDLERARDDVFEAMRSGAVGQIEQLYETYGREIFEKRDEYGHSPAHWMALNGHVAIARFMVQKNLAVDLHSDNSQGPRPIHWASRNGNVAVVDELLNGKVQVDAMDHKGLTPLMMACMFGRSFMAAYLLGRGAQPNLTDMNGDSALHWAAYKGFPSLMQMLIYSGFDPQKPDNFGSSPLHLACISGNLMAVKLLCAKSSVDLEPRDRNRKTPLDLAAKHCHEEIIKFLENEKRRRNTMLPVFLDIWTLVFGQSGKTKGPIFFFLGSVLLWAYPMYFLRCVPVTWSQLPYTHYIFLLMNVVMWISLLAANQRDPGFLARNTEEYRRTIKQIAYHDEWKGQKSHDILRLCHTCRVVRPLRAKHCRICERCVAQFDHHCPYIYNCVGLRNRVWFLMFTLSVAINCSITIFLAFYCISIEGWKLLYIIGLIEALTFCGLGWLLSGFTLLYAAMNLTTNEMFNYKRYNYLKNSREKRENDTSEAEQLIDYLRV